MCVAVVVDHPDADPFARPPVQLRAGGRGRGRPRRVPGWSDATGRRVASEPAADFERGSLPVAGLLGLARGPGSAVWTSLTCFGLTTTACAPGSP